MAIPAPLNWNEAMYMCNKLGSGNMTELQNPEDMEYTVSLFENEPTSCENIWTPLTDEEKEGVYRNAMTKNVASYLPWEVSNPNGFKDENFVLLSMSSKGYIDNVKTKKATCTACDIGIRTEFYLKGVCQETYFGEHRSLFISKLLV